MLYHQQVDKKHWAEAVNTAVYLINRTPCAAWHTKNPFEVGFGKQPDLSDLKVFGCKGFGHVDKSKRTKLDDKAFPCVFLGYSITSKGYRVWNLNTQRLAVTRSATFDERSPSTYVQVMDTDHDRGRAIDSCAADCDDDDPPPPVLTRINERMRLCLMELCPRT
jgi:hypothetical protein